MLSIADFLPILELVAILGGGAIFFFKLGGKMDRLAQSITHLDQAIGKLGRDFYDHEERIRVLERRPAPASKTTTVAQGAP